MYISTKKLSKKKLNNLPKRAESLVNMSVLPTLEDSDRGSVSSLSISSTFELSNISVSSLQLSSSTGPDSVTYSLLFSSFVLLEPVTLIELTAYNVNYILFVTIVLTFYLFSFAFDLAAVFISKG